MQETKTPELLLSDSDEVDMSKDAIKDRLIKLHASTLMQAGILEADAAVLAEDHASPESRRQMLSEGDTTSVERMNVANMSAKVAQSLKDIDDAFKRLEKDTYGLCSACTLPISPFRLEARPAASQCMKCASKGA